MLLLLRFKSITTFILVVCIFNFGKASEGNKSSNESTESTQFRSVNESKKIEAINETKQTNKTDSHMNKVKLTIKSGQPAKQGDLPYQISLKKPVTGKNKYASFCGGTLIAPSSVLTAAHCFEVKGKQSCKLYNNVPDKQKIQTSYAVAGALNRTAFFKAKDSDEKGQWRGLKIGYFPEKYKKWPYLDICLLVTQKPFIYNNFVKALPYARKRIEYSTIKDITCTASGDSVRIPVVAMS